MDITKPSQRASMKTWLKRIGIALGALLLLLGAGLAIFVYVHTSAFDASLAKVYDVKPLAFELSNDPAVLARGKHLSESVVACTASDCHGSDLGGGKTMAMGPLATITGPNISAGGLGAAYSHGELARLIRHGIKKDGRSVRFMPSHDVAWLPDSEVIAIVSYLRTLPPIRRDNGPTEIKTLGKVLDRFDKISLDIARRIDHEKAGRGSAPSETATYGALLAQSCTGCHGNGLSGGRIPGAPPELPVPSNLTPHETGLKGWAYADFDRVLVQGISKSGKKIDPFMPLGAFGKLDETEKRALWAFLQTLPATPLGNR
jgi:mono/diheme cytochrome c family protein